jgi:hypothetical protein
LARWSVSNDQRHSDDFTKTEASTSSSPTAGVRAPTKAVDNRAQSSKASLERDHTFTAGDDAGGTQAPILPAAGSPRALPISAVIARIRSPERPSPFGVAQFPPLPIPPGVDSKG